MNKTPVSRTDTLLMIAVVLLTGVAVILIQILPEDSLSIGLVYRGF